MQYYIFKEACATKETGPVYPQIQKWKPGYDDDKPDSFYSYYIAAKSGGFPDFTPNMDSLVLHGRAKPTDIMSSGILAGFIISKKLKALFDKSALPPHRIYPAKVLHKKTELDGYFFIHIISDYTDFVDYSKSRFVTSGIGNTNPHPISLISKQNYSEKSKQLQDDFFVKDLPYLSIDSTEIYLNSQFNKCLDFFRIGSFDINFYITESLPNCFN